MSRSFLSRSRVLRTLLALCSCAPAGFCGTFDAPPGFNVETRPEPGSFLLTLPDGSQLYATGPFLGQTIVRRLPGGTLLDFAGPFGSLGGAALSPQTGELVVGESAGPAPLLVLRDLNADLDCLDAGEVQAHPAALPVLSNGAAPLPYDLAFRPGTDELYVSGSTPFGISPTLGVVLRVSGGAATVWAAGLGFAGGLDFAGDALHVADLDAATFAGRVVVARDLDHDGDALDAGESTVFAAGLTGANGLAVAQDGSVYLSGLFDVASGSGSVGRLLPDGDGDGLSDGVDEGFLTGFVFSGGLELLEGPAGLAPGVAGDGQLAVAEFGLDGRVLVRSAPFAGTTLAGTVANESEFTLSVGGEPGAGALLALSLDTAGVTLPGLGDLGLGFGQPHLLLVLAPLDGAGQSAVELALRDAEALVGLAFVAQGFTQQAGETGIGDALLLEVAP